MKTSKHEVPPSDGRPDSMLGAWGKAVRFFNQKGQRAGMTVTIGDPIEYQEAQPLMLSGDLAFFEGEYLVSRIIRQWSRFSHVSPIFRVQEFESCREAVLVADASPPLLRPRALSVMVDGYRGRVFWLQVHANRKQREKAADLCFEHLIRSIPYDFSSLFRNMLGRVNQDLARLFCSEWSEFVEVMAEIATPRADGRASRPGDLLRIPGILREIIRHAS